MHLCLLLLLVTALGGSWGLVCPEMCNCEQGAQDIVISCPKSFRNEHITIKFKPADYVGFECNYERDGNDYFSYLAGLQLGPVKHAIFQWCNLPDVSFSELFASANLTSLKTLRFTSYKTVGNGLQPYHFQGLNLTFLSLQSNNITLLPADVFTGMDQLENLNLQQNRLKFPPDFTFDLPSLTFLELGSNELKDFPRTVFQNLTSLDTLNLERNRFETLSRAWFQSLRNLTTLELQVNQLERLPPDVFYDLINLQSIRLLQNKLESLPDGLFSKNLQLENITLGCNTELLGPLNEGIFNGLTKLSHLFLSDSGITEIPSNVFRTNINLQNLSLRGNQLTGLPDQLFSFNVQLVRLDLSKNKLETLPVKIFQGLKNLKVLSLDHNNLANLTDNLFLNLEKLEILHLQYNSLMHIGYHTFPNTKALSYIDLSYNKLNFSASVLTNTSQVSALVFNSCRNLEVLKLRNNYVDTFFLDWSVTFLKLRELDLSRNKIKALSNYDLTNFLSDNLKIMLQDNLIERITIAHQLGVVHLSPAAGATRNISVYLDNNPIDCDCNLLEFVQLLNTDFGGSFKKEHVFHVDNLTCAKPSSLAGQKVKSVDPANLVCEATASCPSNCTCVFQRVKYASVVNCTGARYSSLPDSLLPSLIKEINHSVVYLNNNRLRTLNHPPPPTYANVTELYLSNNNLSEITVKGLPPNLRILYLDGNNLTHLPDSVIDFFVNATEKNNLMLTLHNNPWMCNCDAVNLQKFLQDKFKNVAKGDLVRCERFGTQLAKLTVDELCPGQTQLIIAVCVCLAGLAMVVTILAVLYYRNKQFVQVWLFSHGFCLWYVSEQELDKEKTYDAFVSFSHKDEDFVVTELVTRLENEVPKFKLCIHYRDWHAGELIPDQIVRSVEDSRRTIVILSKNFLESVWGRVEFKMAHVHALEDKTRRVIIIVYGDVLAKDELDKELKEYVSMYTYLQWGDPWFWQKLRYAMPHPPTVSKFRMKKNDKMELIRAEILNHRSPRTSTS